MRLSSAGSSPESQEGKKGVLNSELWHACAGPLVSLPTIGSRVVYFPQGHSEQVAVWEKQEVDVPGYPSLPTQLICQLHNVTMHADIETEEVYAQMTLQPLTTEEQKDVYLPADLGLTSKQPTNYFCKTLTASDTSTHGGFSVPRRAAEKVFPPLDYTLHPPAQELIARDLHENEWKFRHIFRGQPKRHLLTTGWSVFVVLKGWLLAILCFSYGMTGMNCYSVFDVLIDRKQSCHLQFYPVIACIWASWLLLHMRPRRIVVSPHSTIRGLAHVNLLYLSPST